MSHEQLTPLEVASGLVLGRAPVQLPPSDGLGPLATLESLVRPALERPPCLVSFSGGRDSSAVLAVAAHVARREGLALPVPATHRFREAEATDEREWQELIVGALGLVDWLRIENTDELDVVGPVATAVLRRHGLLWPANVHFHAPLLEAAAGGSLLTGIGGDEAFSSSKWSRARAVASGHARPELRDPLRLGLALSPARVRRRVLRRRMSGVFGWLRREAYDAVWDAFAAESATEPFGWQSRIRWLGGARYLQVGVESLARLGADAGAQVVHPLADQRFLAALAALPRRERFADRKAAMQVDLRGAPPGRDPRPRNEGELRRSVLAPPQPGVRSVLERGGGGSRSRGRRCAAGGMGARAAGRAHVHAAPGRVARAGLRRRSSASRRA